MEIVAAVLEVLNDHDPEGLLAMGAPTDEYDAEAVELAVLIPREPPPMEADVEEVWRRWFGEHHHLRGDLLRSVTDELRGLHHRSRSAGPGGLH